jgi:ceramide kinase
LLSHHFRFKIIASSNLALRTEVLRESQRPCDTLELTYVHRNSSDINMWETRNVTMKHTDMDLVMKWKKAFDVQLEQVAKKRPKRLLVFINPYGGVGKAEKVFETKVKPLFDLTGIRYQVIVTERANHAHDLLQTYDFKSKGVDGVICVGGDGMFSELINGILKRAASDNDLDVNDARQDMARPDIKIGVIPGGSTDALAYSLHGADDVITSTLHIVLGDEKLIDAASVFSEGTLTRFSSTMMSYGYFGDLLFRSENYRWLGPTRYDVSGTQTLLAGRSYRGVVSYVEEVNPSSKPEERKLCTSKCDICNVAEKDEADAPNLVVRRDCIKGKFMNVTGAMMTCSCHRTPKGISPGAHLGDGNADLILVKETSRLNYLRYLIRVGFQKDNPFELPFVEVKRVREFSFTATPKPEKTTTRTSVWNCDGEIIDQPNIHVKVHRRVIRVFGRGPETSEIARPTNTTVTVTRSALKYLTESSTRSTCMSAEQQQKREEEAEIINLVV